MLKRLACLAAALVFSAGAAPESLTEETGQRIAEALERIADALEGRSMDYSRTAAPSRPPRGLYTCEGEAFRSSSGWYFTESANSECRSALRRECLILGFDRYSELEAGPVLPIDETAEPVYATRSVAFECRKG